MISSTGIPNSAELIENALSPAKVISVIADDDDKTAKVIVPDYQLSLAIGKEGQNARLAARLTGFKIDIKSETQARESGEFDELLKHTIITMSLAMTKSMSMPKKEKKALRTPKKPQDPKRPQSSKQETTAWAR